MVFTLTSIGLCDKMLFGNFEDKRKINGEEKIIDP